MAEEKRQLKVFLCHARADKEKVRELYRYLRKRGIQPWLDAVDLVGGQNWREEIPKAIKASDAIIICLSKNSINKEGYVQAEIAFALEKALEIPPGRIFIIPALFEDCEVPDSLERYQWVDLFEKDGFPRLMKSLRTRASQLERATVEVPRPDETSPDLGSTSEDDKKKEQELELKKLESQAVQFELKGDFWSASKTWYEIKRIDSLYPRVDIKIRELEGEIARERAVREAAEMGARKEAIEKAKREREEQRAVQIAALKETLSKSFTALKSALPKALPFLRIVGFTGIVIALLWGGLLGVSKLPSLVPTATPSATITPIVAYVSPTKTIVPIATKTKSPTSTPTTTPTITATFTPIPTDSFLFQENFEDDTFVEWLPKIGSLVVGQELDGNHYLALSGPASDPPQFGYENKKTPWIDYALETRVKFIKGRILFILVRAAGESDEFYGVAVDRSNVGFMRRWSSLGSTISNVLDLNRWYTIRVEIKGDLLSVYIDNALIHELKLQPPLITHGGIAFVTYVEDEIYFDDIRVWSLVK